MWLHSENGVCTLLDEMCPHVKVLTQTCQWAFLDNSIGTKILRCEIFLAQRQTLLQGFPPFKDPTSQLLDGLCPRSEANANSTLLQGFPLLWGLTCSWDFSHSETRFTSSARWQTITWELYAKSVLDISKSKQISSSRHQISKQIQSKSGKI